MHVQLKSQKVQEWLVLFLEGRIESTNYSRVLAAIKSLLTADETRVALDLSKLDFIGIAAMKELLGISAILRKSEGELVVVAPNAAVRRHLESFAGNGGLRVFQDLDELQTGIYLRPRAEFNSQGSLHF